MRTGILKDTGKVLEFQNVLEKYLNLQGQRDVVRKWLSITMVCHLNACKRDHCDLSEQRPCPINVSFFCGV